MVDKIAVYKSIENPFFMESIEDGTNTEQLRYYGRGESVYADGRQVLVRSCHDALVSLQDGRERGILLIRRKAEPAYGYLWPLGGFFDRGVSSKTSLASRIKSESGLEVNEESWTILGHARMMWKTTPNKQVEEKKLPLGIDDTGVLYYGFSLNGTDSLNLDRLHEMPTIVTAKMYTDSFREQLHPYVQFGMDRAIRLL